MKIYCQKFPLTLYKNIELIKKILGEILEISLQDARYPELLRQISDPPERLFVWGNPDILSSTALGIVGSRKPSDYGLRVATQLSRELCPYLTIISGLAYGIDTVALTEAFPNGRAVAVIGSGLDRKNFYPSSNWRLAEQIVSKGGAIISEYPEGTPPLKHHFPARNRIIAGLTQGVLVVEAAQKSGALITADLALQFNREVFAIAGSIFAAQAQGTNQLIKDGAQIVTSFTDILEVFGITSEGSQAALSLELTPIESAIINILNSESRGWSVNELTVLVQLDSPKVSSTLTMMEIKGMVRNAGAGKFTCLVN